MRQIYYYRLGSIAARLGCYAVRAGLKLRAAVALPPIFTIERLNREIRRRTRVVGTFPDGNSALMLVCARIRHVAGTQWGNKKYMNMKHLEAALDDASIAG